MSREDRLELAWLVERVTAIMVRIAMDQDDGGLKALRKAYQVLAYRVLVERGVTGP